MSKDDVENSQSSNGLEEDIETLEKQREAIQNEINELNNTIEDSLEYKLASAQNEYAEKREKRIIEECTEIMRTIVNDSAFLKKNTSEQSQSTPTYQECIEIIGDVKGMQKLAALENTLIEQQIQNIQENNREKIENLPEDRKKQIIEQCTKLIPNIETDDCPQGEYTFEYCVNLINNSHAKFNSKPEFKELLELEKIPMFNIEGWTQIIQKNGGVYDGILLPTDDSQTLTEEQFESIATKVASKLNENYTKLKSLTVECKINQLRTELVKFSSDTKNEEQAKLIITLSEDPDLANTLKKDKKLKAGLRWVRIYYTRNKIINKLPKMPKLKMPDLHKKNIRPNKTISDLTT